MKLYRQYLKKQPTHVTDYLQLLCTLWIMHVKADSHIACHAHAVPLPCCALIHTCRAVPLPCSDSARSSVKVRVVPGNI